MEHVKGNILKYINAVMQNTSLLHKSNYWWFQSILGQLDSCMLLCFFNLKKQRKHCSWLYTQPLLHWRWDMVIQLRRFSLGAGRAQKHLKTSETSVLDCKCLTSLSKQPASMGQSQCEQQDCKHLAKGRYCWSKHMEEETWCQQLMNCVTTNIQCYAR